MSSSAIQNRLVNHVVNSLTEHPAAAIWLQSFLFNSPQAIVDDLAKTFLQTFHQSQPLTNQKRYKFKPLSPTDELLKVIFEESFYHDPNLLIKEAQAADPTQSYYPRWKKICWIHIPMIIGDAFQHPLIKIVVSIGTIYCSYKVIKSAADGVVHFFSARAFSRTFKAQASFAVFLIKMSIDQFGFVWDQCDEIGAFFCDIAIKAYNEQLATSKSKAYAVWKKVIAENIPKR
jgi:hypothetical protein